ncbi:hypothetical protein GGX14DRAFT_565016 [Mycena pura]|uniref:Uncharacterized protein n=1 Tax=Mycena pura TaxID=153505 RepID=A0AAD6VFD9_9AGAR|nr:hypothetical protein GGX14DRAFT_565016 [Mycena pura]
MNAIAACFLAPHRALYHIWILPAFFSDYIHTVVIFTIILAASFSKFATTAASEKGDRANAQNDVPYEVV